MSVSSTSHRMHSSRWRWPRLRICAGMLTGAMIAGCVGSGSAPNVPDESELGYIPANQWVRSLDVTAHEMGLGADDRRLGRISTNGTTDILLQHTDTGLLAEWLMSNGSVAAVRTLFTPGAQVVGTGDFNGDGTTDILFQHANQGLVAAWLMSNGTIAAVQTLFTPGAQVVATGNFDGP